ncbi:MAG: winged helix-turn-helix domain-containing protein [Patescibacteria group bacterium]
MESIKSQCAKCFKAVGTPARLKIFMVAKKGKVDISKLEKIIGLRQPTITFHVNQLVKAGLLQKSKSGRNVFVTTSIHCTNCPLYS